MDVLLRLIPEDRAKELKWIRPLRHLDLVRRSKTSGPRGLLVCECSHNGTAHIFRHDVEITQAEEKSCVGNELRDLYAKRCDEGISQIASDLIKWLDSLVAESKS